MEVLCQGEELSESMPQFSSYRSVAIEKSSDPGSKQQQLVTLALQVANPGLILGTLYGFEPTRSKH